MTPRIDVSANERHKRVTDFYEQLKKQVLLAAANWGAADIKWTAASLEMYCRNLFDVRIGDDFIEIEFQAGVSAITFAMPALWFYNQWMGMQIRTKFNDTYIQVG